MMILTRTLVMSTALMIGGVAAAAPKVGQQAPAFKLPGHDGKTYELSKLKGKYVVLEWFNNDCPYVEKHYHSDHRNMQNLQNKWVEKASKEGKELVWFAVVTSPPGAQGHVTPEEAKKLKEEERKAHMSAFLLDPEGTVGRLYAAKTTPHMFVINPDGVLQYDGAIDDKPSANIASLRGANNYVDAALTSLFAGKSVAQSTTTPYGCSVKYKD